MAGFGDEGGADAASKFGTDGNVLQVGIGRGETARGRSRLTESRMQAARGWVDENRQRVYVRGFELCELAVVEDHPGNGMVFGQVLEDIYRGRNCSALAVLDRLGQVHPVEKNISQLSGRADIEFRSRDFVYFLGLRANLTFKVRRHPGQRCSVVLHSRLFHALT